VSSKKWKLRTVSLLQGSGSYYIQVRTKDDRLEFKDRQQKDWTKVVQMTSSYPSMRIGGSYLTGYLWLLFVLIYSSFLLVT